MKKVLALLLAVVMVIGLCACAAKDDGDTAPKTDKTPATDTKKDAEPAGDDAVPPPATSGSAYPNAVDGKIDLNTIAHYDTNYDYSQNQKFKIAYLALESGPLYEQSAVAYEHWCPLFNCEWKGFVGTNGDSDLFLTTLETMISDGVNGFILDPDFTIFPAVLAVLEQHPEVQWMSQMSIPRDGDDDPSLPAGGNMIHPYVGFDHKDAGKQVAQRCVDWLKETYPDVPMSEVAFLAIDFSTSPQLHERVEGSKEVWLANGGSEENFIVADGVSNGLNLQGGLDTVSPVIATNSQYKYWLVNGLIDDMAQAAASVLAQQGLTETSCVADFGGSGLQIQWDGGQQDAYRYALFTAQTLYGEPIFGAVYAFLMGWATPDTIWPDWIKYDDHGVDGHMYAQLRLPTEWLEYETYQHYLEWTDLYTHADVYNYPTEGVSIDDFTPFVSEVPAEYNP